MNVNADKIKIAMARACMNSGDLAKAAGISGNGLQVIFKRGRASTATIGKIARALSMDVTEILELEE